MLRYKNFAPTGFDRAGAFLPERQDWLVMPMAQNRDSAALERSNFECALRKLGGESETVEVHRFGHWGPGWFEIILVKPDTESAAIAQEIADHFADYLVVDETHYSGLEYNEVCDQWARMRIKDRMECLAKFGYSIFAARRDYLPDCDNGSLYEYLRTE